MGTMVVAPISIGATSVTTDLPSFSIVIGLAGWASAETGIAVSKSPKQTKMVTVLKSPDFFLTQIFLLVNEIDHLHHLHG
jgi:hypothetical protein